MGRAMNWQRARRPYVRQIDRELEAFHNPPKRKPRPLTTEAAEAIDYARSYTGDFPFMVDMRGNARCDGWVPTPKQAAAILRCRDRDNES